MPTTSFSEVSSYLLCRRKHFYGYSRGLERIDTSVSLSEGKLAHAALEAYYTCFLTDKTSSTATVHERGVAAAQAVFDASGYEYDDTSKRADISKILFAYYFPNEPFATQNYRVLAVEKEFVLEWDSLNENRFPFVIDLILRDPYGRTCVVDHKTAYDFIDEDAAELQPQVPLYLAGLKALGYPADYGVYNQLRTRKIVGKKSAENPFGEGPTLDQAIKWTAIPVNNSRLVQSFEEQAAAAIEINERKMLPLEVQDKRSFRVANKMVCNSCAFKELCKGELNGSNTALIERTYFKQRERRNFALVTEAVE